MDSLNKVLATENGYKMNVLNSDNNLVTIYAPNIELLFKRSLEARK